MTNIIGRTSFLEETSTLFTDEKVANARSKIIEWINGTATGDTSTKCEAIVKIQETILKSCIELLDEFLDNILSMSHDPSQDVRRSVIGFIEQTCKTKIEYLPRVINVLAMLLRDPSPQVIKRVIQACGSIYKNAIQWISSPIDISDSVEQAWNTLCLMKAQILDMIDNDNDGIRTNAIKFLEGVVILQSYPDEDSMKRDNDFSLEDVPLTLKIARRRKLEDEALNIFDCLLKFHAAVHISSVNLITCTGVLCKIAKLRPSLMALVINAIKNLQSNLPPTLTDSQVNSVRKNLKMQLINLLKNRVSYEIQTTIIELLHDLGASQTEILRSIPKTDKYEQQRRSKRLLLDGINSNLISKRIKIDTKEQQQQQQQQNLKSILSNDSRQMEIDYDELEEQKLRCTKINEKFLLDGLKNIDNVIQLVMVTMKNLPNEPTKNFLDIYKPIIDVSIGQQINKIALQLAEQMTNDKIGPGCVELTKELPMKPCVTLDEEKMIIQSMRKDHQQQQQQQIPQHPNAGSVVIETELNEDDEEIYGEDAEDDNNSNKFLEEDSSKIDEITKQKFHETIENAKSSVVSSSTHNEQAIIQKMKQRVKTLKLQEITKILTRNMKEQYMINSVKRILKSERSCIIGGVSGKRRKILTVMASTFPDIIRDIILEFILMDIKNRLDLAFSWLYEEYCLLQGFTRHSYIKSENKPDYAYNKLLIEIISGICANCEYKDKIILLKKIYLESPILSDESINYLIKICEEQEDNHNIHNNTQNYNDLIYHILELIKDLIIRRPPKKQKFLQILLTYCYHQKSMIRDRALQNLLSLYAVHKILTKQIEECAIKWLNYIQLDVPPPEIFSMDYGRMEQLPTWTEDLVKICLTLFLTLLPYREELLQNLAKVYVATSADLKRTILRSIEIPIKKMGSENSEILNLIENCPKGCETLITRFIYILTERTASALPFELIKRVRELYKNKVNDVRLLIPILHGLTKQEIINALPKLLKMNPIVVKEVFNRLFGIGTEYSNQQQQLMTGNAVGGGGGTGTGAPITPGEILIALHNIDTTKCELKFIIKATSICLAEKQIYTQDVLAQCLQQLIEIIPIPTLLMRTVIQSLTLYPKLSGFVVNLLQRLILKQIWKQKIIWDGFLKCCQRLKPQSLPVLIQLPGQQLQDALCQCPDLREPLIEYAQSIMESQVGQVSQQTMDILHGITTDVFVTDESGGYIQIENIKKEKEDPDYNNATTTTTAGSGDVGQPLPPGED